MFYVHLCACLTKTHSSCECKRVVNSASITLRSIRMSVHKHEHCLVKVPRLGFGTDSVNSPSPCFVSGFCLEEINSHCDQKPYCRVRALGNMRKGETRKVTKINSYLFACSINVKMGRKKKTKNKQTNKNNNNKM